MDCCGSDAQGISLDTLSFLFSFTAEISFTQPVSCTTGFSCGLCDGNFATCKVLDVGTCDE